MKNNKITQVTQKNCKFTFTPWSEQSLGGLSRIFVSLVSRRVAFSVSASLVSRRVAFPESLPALSVVGWPFQSLVSRRGGLSRVFASLVSRRVAFPESLSVVGWPFQSLCQPGQS